MNFVYVALAFAFFSIGFAIAGSDYIELGKLVITDDGHNVFVYHENFVSSEDDFVFEISGNGWNRIHSQEGESVHIGVGDDDFYIAGGELGPSTNNFYKDLLLNDHEGTHVRIQEARSIQTQELCLYSPEREICITVEDLYSILENF